MKILRPCTCALHRRHWIQCGEPSGLVMSNFTLFGTVRAFEASPLISASSNMKVRVRAKRRAIMFFAAMTTMSLSYADSLTLYNGRAVDSDLLDLPEKLLSGTLAYKDCRFTGLGYKRSFITPYTIGWMFGAANLSVPESAFEVVALKHRGLQTNSEVALAYHLNFAGAALGPVKVKPGFSWGFSRALGKPTYENGPRNDPERRYRFQHHLGLELAFTATESSPWSVISKVHHRSGGYGMIAPRRVGSNFLALGIQYLFE